LSFLQVQGSLLFLLGLGYFILHFIDLTQISQLAIFSYGLVIFALCYQGSTGTNDAPGFNTFRQISEKITISAHHQQQQTG
jgi:hypothetical protein